MLFRFILFLALWFVSPLIGCNYGSVDVRPHDYSENKDRSFESSNYITENNSSVKYGEEDQLTSEEARSLIGLLKEKFSYLDQSGISIDDLGKINRVNGYFYGAMDESLAVDALFLSYLEIFLDIDFESGAKGNLFEQLKKIPGLGKLLARGSKELIERRPVGALTLISLSLSISNPQELKGLEVEFAEIFPLLLRSKEVPLKSLVRYKSYYNSLLERRPELRLNKNIDRQGLDYFEQIEFKINSDELKSWALNNSKLINRVFGSSEEYNDQIDSNSAIGLISLASMVNEHQIGKQTLRTFEKVKSITFKSNKLMTLKEVEDVTSSLTSEWMRLHSLIDSRTKKLRWMLSLNGFGDSDQLKQYLLKYESSLKNRIKLTVVYPTMYLVSSYFQLKQIEIKELTVLKRLIVSSPEDSLRELFSGKTQLWLSFGTERLPSPGFEVAKGIRVASRNGLFDGLSESTMVELMMGLKLALLEPIRSNLSVLSRKVSRSLENSREWREMKNLCSGEDSIKFRISESSIYTNPLLGDRQKDAYGFSSDRREILVTAKDKLKIEVTRLQIAIDVYRQILLSQSVVNPTQEVSNELSNFRSLVAPVIRFVLEHSSCTLVLKKRSYQIVLEILRRERAYAYAIFDGLIGPETVDSGKHESKIATEKDESSIAFYKSNFHKRLVDYLTKPHSYLNDISKRLLPKNIEIKVSTKDERAKLKFLNDRNSVNGHIRVMKTSDREAFARSYLQGIAKDDMGKIIDPLELPGFHGWFLSNGVNSDRGTDIYLLDFAAYLFSFSDSSKCDPLITNLVLDCLMPQNLDGDSFAQKSLTVNLSSSSFEKGHYEFISEMGFSKYFGPRRAVHSIFEDSVTGEPVKYLEHFLDRIMYYIGVPEYEVRWSFGLDTGDTADSGEFSEEAGLVQDRLFDLFSLQKRYLELGESRKFVGNSDDFMDLAQRKQSYYGTLIERKISFFSSLRTSFSRDYSFPQYVPGYSPVWLMDGIYLNDRINQVKSNLIWEF